MNINERDFERLVFGVAFVGICLIIGNVVYLTGIQSGRREALIENFREKMEKAGEIQKNDRQVEMTELRAKARIAHLEAELKEARDLKEKWEARAVEERNSFIEAVEELKQNRRLLFLVDDYLKGIDPEALEALKKEAAEALKREEVTAPK